MISGLLAVIDMQRVFADPDSPWPPPDSPKRRRAYDVCCRPSATG